MDIYQRKFLEIEKVNKKYHNEIEEYKRKVTKEKNEKIFEKLQQSREFEVEISSFLYGGILLNVSIKHKSNEFSIDVDFFDFDDFDAKSYIVKLLLGEKYCLCLNFYEEFISYRTIERAYKSMKKVKKIIDEILEV